MFYLGEVYRDVIIDELITNYEVSTLGRVRNKTRGKVLRPKIDRDGYLIVGIYANDRIYHIGVHRLVAIAFLRNPYNKPTVNHENGNKLDCCVNNLKWATYSEQRIHAIAMKLACGNKGTDHWNHKITESEAIKICKLLEDGLTRKKISEITGVGMGIVSSIKEGSNWTHISKDFIIPSGIKYSPEFKNQIRALLNRGFKPNKILSELNLVRSNALITLIEKLQMELKHSRNK